MSALADALKQDRQLQMLVELDFNGSFKRYATQDTAVHVPEVLGSELVTNGTFDTTIDNWSVWKRIPTTRLNGRQESCTRSASDRHYRFKHG